MDCTPTFTTPHPCSLCTTDRTPPQPHTCPTTSPLNLTPVPCTKQLERNRERNNADQYSQQARVEVTDEDDKVFISQLTDNVEAWLARGGEEGGEQDLVLAPASAFRRLLTYQALGGERFTAGGHRGFVVRKVRVPGCVCVVVNVFLWVAGWGRRTRLWEGSDLRLKGTGVSWCAR